jgi:hypothetical protein
MQANLSPSAKLTGLHGPGVSLTGMVPTDRAPHRRALHGAYTSLRACPSWVGYVIAVSLMGVIPHGRAPHRRVLYGRVITSWTYISRGGYQGVYLPGAVPDRRAPLWLYILFACMP